MSMIIDAEALGRRIRKLRNDRRMTLKQVEARCGLSATHLSEMERGRTSPTIGALVRIARALEKDPSFFLENEERADAAHHLREQVQALEPAPGVRAESLTPGIPGSTVFAYRVRITPGKGHALNLAAQELHGDAIVHVSAGSLEAEVGASRVTLTAGDSLHSSLAHGHTLRASGDDAAEFHLVLTRSLTEAR